jgi:hypothetical protein
VNLLIMFVIALFLAWGEKNKKLHCGELFWEFKFRCVAQYTSRCKKNKSKKEIKQSSKRKQTKVEEF